MKKNIVVCTDRLKIKTLRVKDVTPEYVNGLNDSEVNKFLVNVRLQKQTKEKVSGFILHNLQSPYDILLGVFLKEGNVFMGTIRIGDISNFHYSCSIGICFFNKKYWGKGYAFEAMEKVCGFIFKKLKLHYIEAGVYEGNHASMKLFKRAGFMIQACYKDKYRYQDDFKPVVTWGLINTKFNMKGIK